MRRKPRAGYQGHGHQLRWGPVSGNPVINGPPVSAPFTATAPGLYTVSFKTVSHDGVPSSDAFTFTLTGGTNPSPQKSGSPPVAAQATASSDSSSSVSVWPWLIAIAAVIASGLLGFLLGRRRSV